MFGCLPPSLGKYDIPICKNGSFFSRGELDKFIDCPKSCTVYKMRTYEEEVMYIIDLREVEFKLMPISSVSIIFHELITMSTDQYSYNWLNLVAEVGGYVGLFLGYSVFQLTDLLDKIIFFKIANSNLLPKKIPLKTELKVSP